ncbi:MAG: hypothetical protein AB7T37_12215 [Dehalococcoidia bacterium]
MLLPSHRHQLGDRRKATPAGLSGAWSFELPEVADAIGSIVGRPADDAPETPTNRDGPAVQYRSHLFEPVASITGSFIFYQNADSENGFGANPTCFDGGMIITSNVPVVAVASSITDLKQGDGEGVYNAITP